MPVKNNLAKTKFANLRSNQVGKTYALKWSSAIYRVLASTFRSIDTGRAYVVWLFCDRSPISCVYARSSLPEKGLCPGFATRKEGIGEGIEDLNAKHPHLFLRRGAGSSDPAGGRHDRRGQRLMPRPVAGWLTLLGVPCLFIPGSQ